MSVREYRFGPSKASCPKCPVSSQVRPRLLFLLLSVFLLDFPPLPRTRSSFFPKAQHQTILCTCVSKQYCHLFLSATSSPSSSCCEPLWTDSLDSPDAVVCMAPINSARLCAEGPTRDSLSPSTVLFWSYRRGSGIPSSPRLVLLSHEGRVHTLAADDVRVDMPLSC